MRKKIVAMLATVMALLFVFAGCGGKEGDDIPPNLVAVLENGKEIALYMDREEAEKLIGKKGEKDKSGIYDYEGIEIGYTDGVVSMIHISNEKHKTRSGVKVGMDSSILEKNDYPSDGPVPFTIYYTFDSGKFTKEKEIRTTSAKAFQEAANTFAQVRDDEITDIWISDLYVASRMKFDED